MVHDSSESGIETPSSADRLPGENCTHLPPDASVHQGSDATGDTDPNSGNEPVNAADNSDSVRPPVVFDHNDLRGRQSGDRLAPTRPFETGELAQVDDVPRLGDFGDYELLEKIAYGGMGVVFKARQISLDRIVALKTIRHGRMSSVGQIQRLRAEARAAAALHHPNIVPIYDFGEVDGIYFFTMEFVDGPSLAHCICGRPLKPVEAASYVKRIAHTIAYAHECGIVHRDLKPSNIMIGDGDQLRVTDFGLARSTKQGSGLTGEGFAVGTPTYMSPEQSLGNGNATPKSSDIYSLGAVLYELLTGRPPFDAGTAVDTLIEVRTKEPTRPRSLDPKVPRDLETVCLKCLEKAPQQRYATCDELAADLGRYLEGRPISARPVPSAERLWRVCRRNPWLSSFVLLSFVLLLLLVISWIVILNIGNARLNRMNKSLTSSNRLLEESKTELSASIDDARRFQKVAEQRRQAAEHDKRRSEELLYVADMKEAGNAWRDGDVRHLSELLKRHRPVGDAIEYQGGEWHFLSNYGRIPHRHVAHHTEPVYFVCYSPDGRSLATAGQDAVIRSYNAKDFRLELEIPTGQIEVNGLAFSPDGLTLASAGDDGTIRLWSLDKQSNTAILVRTIRAHVNQAYNVLFTPDGEKLVSAGREPEVKVWDPATGRLIAVLKGHDESAGAIALHPDGNLLASASHDGDIVLWDLSSQSQVRQITAGRDKLLSVAFSPNGELLASCSKDTTVEIRDWKLDKVVRAFNHLDTVQRLAFTPDGDSVVASDESGMIRIWPLSSDVQKSIPFLQSNQLGSWKAHRDRIYALVVSPDGQELISAGSDGLISAWGINASRPSGVLQKSDGEIGDFAFIPGSNLLATIDQHSLELWDPFTLDRNGLLERTDADLLCLAVSRDGSTIVAAGKRGTVNVSRLTGEGDDATYNIGRDYDVHRVALSPDGSLLAAVNRVGGSDDRLYVMDSASGSRLKRITATECNSVAFSTDGRWLCASGPKNVIRVWDLQSQMKVADRTAHVSSIHRIRFGPFGKTMATCSDDRLVTIWNCDDWETRFTLGGHRHEVIALAYSADGRTLASGARNGVLRLWHIATGQELFDIDFAPDYPAQIEFSPDGRFLACLLHGPKGRRIQLFQWRESSK